MKLTKEQAIYEHRKMWNWIADEHLRNKSKVRHGHLKGAYLRQIGLEDKLLHNCFCCEYTSPNSCFEDCSNCPVEWGSECSEYMCENSNNNEDPGLWIRYFRTSDYEEAANLARMIANLPERWKL